MSAEDHESGYQNKESNKDFALKLSGLDVKEKTEKPCGKHFLNIKQSFLSQQGDLQ